MGKKSMRKQHFKMPDDNFDKADLELIMNIEYSKTETCKKYHM